MEGRLQDTARPGVNCRHAIHPILAGVLLVGVTLLAFWPAQRGGFIWDDNIHLTQNPSIVGPLELKTIWTSKAARICPLVLTTFWVEHALWGLKPFPYHLVNVLMHAACGLVLWRVLRSLRVRGAWFGAVLWTLHPVQVESVAWITEMKNTQSGLFYLLAILAFAKSKIAEQANERGRSNGYYGLTILFAVLAMASKASTIVLPVVLALCAWWMDGRWQWRRNIIKLAPILLLSALAAVLAIWTQRLEGAVGPDWQRSWLERIVVAGKVVWFYLGKLAWPQPLMFVYPRWEVDSTRLLSYLPALAVVVVLLVLWRDRNGRGRPLFFGFAYFLVALAPVSGLVNHYFLRYSFVGDHFQYLASMSVLALAGSGIAAALSRLGLRRRSLSPALCGVLVFALGSLAWKRTFVFQSNEALWGDTLARNPDCWLAHNNLGVVFEHQGKVEEAESQFRAAIALKPTFVEAISSLGAHLARKGLVEDGMNCFYRALQIDPAYPGALYNLGNALVSQVRYADAIPLLENALQVNPGDYEARNILGYALARLGRVDEAMEQYRFGLRYKPDDAPLHKNLAEILVAKGQLDEAIGHYRQALQTNPNDHDIHYLLGIALALQGKWDEAIQNYEEKLRWSPTDVEAQYNLGYALRVRGRNDEAITHLNEALRWKPEFPLAHYNLGCALADKGLRSEAVRHLREALWLKPDYEEVRQKLRALGASEGEVQ